MIHPVGVTLPLRLATHRLKSSHEKTLRTLQRQRIHDENNNGERIYIGRL